MRISLPFPNLAMAALISLSFFTSKSPSYNTALSKSHCTESLESTSNSRWIERKTQENPLERKSEEILQNFIKFELNCKNAPQKIWSTKSNFQKNSRRKRSSQVVPDALDCSNASLDRELTPPELPKKKGRGPAIMRKSTDKLEDRPIIWLVGPREFTCGYNPNQIKTAITR